jgi:polyphosphate kinase
MTKNGRFFNRELSWVEFNARVLSEALDPELPLLDRLRFICIVTSNFDEFFMVRVAAIKRQIRSGDYVTCPSGLTPREQLEQISTRVRELVKLKYDCLLTDIFPKLADEGLVMKAPEDYTQAQASYLRRLFQDEIFPVLSPVRAEQGRPFPYSGNMRLHAGFLLSSEETGSPLQGPDGGPQIAIVQIPRSLDRIIWLPEDESTVSFALLEHVVIENAELLFPGYRIRETVLFRVTRDADFGVDEDREDDFVEAMEQVLERREFSEPVRLSVNRDQGELARLLISSLGVGPEDVYVKPEPLDLGGFMDLTFHPGFDSLRRERWRPVDPPQLPMDGDVWDTLKRQDALLFHPYESFEPVVSTLEQAADDPGVLAIKMTLYRTSGDSPIIDALERAAQNGKQVTALVELKARFDEQRNITWAERLERAGVIVIYGIAQLKVHAKAALIVRREPNGVKRYVHLGTGNYNDKTAKLYTDFGLLTSREDLSYEVSLFFNAITGYSAIPVLNKLSMAPTALKSRLIQLVQREAMRTSADNPGLIIAKMNSLSDPEVIEALYSASQEGVIVQLNVRGVCLLVPGVEGMSENITVVSIVDRYLEHARAFYFYNEGKEEVYCASADWMPRNLDRRVELMFPVEQHDLRGKLKHILRTCMQDNQKSHLLKPTGRYVKRSPADGERAVHSQAVFYQDAKTQAESADPANRTEFSVRRKPPKPGRV